jgi:hypothetical protein
MSYGLLARPRDTPLAQPPHLISKLQSFEWGLQTARYAVQGAEAQLRRIGEFAPNWDGAGSPAPGRGAIFNASTNLPALYLASRVTPHRWRSPHVSASEQGEVSFEWWRDERKLTMYFGDDTIKVIKVWGPHIHDEMEEVDLHDPVNFSPLWAWLHGD